MSFCELSKTIDVVPVSPNSTVVTLRKSLNQDHALVGDNTVQIERFGLLRYEAVCVSETAVHLKRPFDGMSALSLTMFGYSWKRRVT